VGADAGGLRHRGVRDFHSLEQFINANVNSGSEVRINFQLLLH